jgi:hypothetical protein
LLYEKWRYSLGDNPVFLTNNRKRSVSREEHGKYFTRYKLDWWDIEVHKVYRETSRDHLVDIRTILSNAMQLTIHSQVSEHEYLPRSDWYS